MEAVLKWSSLVNSEAGKVVSEAKTTSKFLPVSMKLVGASIVYVDEPTNLT